MSLRQIIHTILGVFYLAPGFSFSEKEYTTTSLLISFDHRVGNQPLKLDTLMYTNSLGQAFSISKLKYYIGKLSLHQANGKSYHAPGYFLINEEEADSRQIRLENVPAGTFTSLEFIIGVDSLDNCSGAQSGALDPANGMFWAWNSGYIFLKLEGFSPASSAPGHVFEYHIGGYRHPNNCIRKIKLDLPAGDDIAKTLLTLNVNVLELLETPSPVDFSKLPSVTDFRKAVTIADNYKDMFSIVSKH